MDQMAELARQDPRPVVELYFAGSRQAFALVWRLQGLTDERVLAVFRDALKHPSYDVRWAAIEGLKHFSGRDLIAVCVAALKDRSHLGEGGVSSRPDGDRARRGDRPPAG